MKKTVFLCLLGCLTFMYGCKMQDDLKPQSGGTKPQQEHDVETSGINWDNEPSGTLTVANDTAKDMIIFQGQSPSKSNILGGVLAGKTKTFDISDKVDDFSVGGYMILRAVSKDEYEKHSANLSAAKIEYSAMATYGQGKKFRTEIRPDYIGEYYFKVTNAGRIGMELRKNSPDGEKIGYLPALATNYALYSKNSDDLTIFPVYVYYDSLKKTVTTIRSTSFLESVSIGPRPVTDSSVATTILPNNPSITWNQIVSHIAYPVAFITVTNNVANQSCRVQTASTRKKAQNGYDSLNSGETATFEIKSTDTGTSISLNCALYGGTVTVPMKLNNGTSIIKNGYDYTVTLDYIGGDLDKPASYKAVLTEGVKRDISDSISSL